MLGGQGHQGGDPGVTAENHYSLGRILGDLKSEKFGEELRGSWSTAVLYRVPSLFLVWGLARLRVGPMTVSAVAVLLALSLPAQAYALPLTLAPVCVALSGMLFQVLDCADGTLARVLDRTSKVGGHVDFLTDMMQWGLLYLALGILADRTLGTGWGWTAVAGAGAWTRLLARVVRDRLSDGANGPPPPVTPMNAVPVFLAGISGLIPFLALLIYGVLDVLEGLIPLLAMLRR